MSCHENFVILIRIINLGSLLKCFRLRFEAISQENVRMTASFRCYVTNQRLSVLDYDEKKTNGRYRAVINEDKVAVIQLHHLQTVEAEDTSVSQLSLCSGVLESNLLKLFSKSNSTEYLDQLFIEKVDEDIVYRYEY